MTHRRLAVGIFTALTVLVGACSQNTQGSGSPSSSLAPLSIPSTTINNASNGDGNGASIPPASVAPEDAPDLNPSEVLSTITVNQVGACVDGQGTLLVSHDPRASAVLRQITAIIDGTQSSSDFSSGAAQFEVAGVACDDRIHTVLIAAVGRDGSTQSRAFAVRISS